MTDNYTAEAILQHIRELAMQELKNNKHYKTKIAEFEVFHTMLLSNPSVELEKIIKHWCKNMPKLITYRIKRNDAIEDDITA